MTTGNDLFSQLTPEQLSALLQGGTLQDKGTLLQQQLEQLLGQQPQHVEHSTPLGAGLGGIAEAGEGIANAFHAKALRGQQQQNLDAQGKLMGDFGALLRGPQQAATNQPANPTEITPEWGMDLSQSDVPTSALPPNQPADPTQIVDDGSDGWGLDLSDPKHLAAILRNAQPATPTQVAARAPVPQSIHPGMPGRRGPRLLDDSEQFSPFGY